MNGPSNGSQAIRSGANEKGGANSTIGKTSAATITIGFERRRVRGGGTHPGIGADTIDYWLLVRFKW